MQVFEVKETLTESVQVTLIPCFLNLIYKNAFFYQTTKIDTVAVSIILYDPENNETN